MKPLLLCSDLDRTLLPNGPQPESPRARECFSRLVSHPDIVLTFVTGRNRRLIEKAITNYSLPHPDFIISDAGTNIYDLRAGAWEQWQEWQQEIAVDWSGKSYNDLHQLLCDVRELRLQEYTNQGTFKLSYYIPMHADRRALNRDLTGRLSAHNIAAQLVWSIDNQSGIGLLDVLPKRASKLFAIKFLQQRLGIAMDDTLFAGDSGKDIEVLSSPIPAVLVANAMPLIAEEVISTAKHSGNGDSVYLAKGGFHGMNGHYSAGVLEGVAHFQPELTETIADICQGESDTRD